MKRVLALLAIAGLSAAVGACGDDSGDDDDGVKNDAGNDAGKPDAGKDASTDATGPRGQQIDDASLGAACTSAANCSGAGTLSCRTSLPTAPTLPGGYCTAECTASAECGPHGACPTGDAASNSLITMRDPGAASIAMLLPKVCLEKCEAADAGTSGTCRAGYVCTPLLPTLLPLVPEGMARNGFAALGSVVPSFGLSYCLPGAPAGDAGTSALIVGGLDSGL